VLVGSVGVGKCEAYPEIAYADPTLQKVIAPAFRENILEGTQKVGEHLLRIMPGVLRFVCCATLAETRTDPRISNRARTATFIEMHTCLYLRFSIFTRSSVSSKLGVIAATRSWIESQIMSHCKASTKSPGYNPEDVLALVGVGLVCVTVACVVASAFRRLTRLSGHVHTGCFRSKP
jgi:hypothetical protein